MPTVDWSTDERNACTRPRSRPHVATSCAASCPLRAQFFDCEFVQAQRSPQARDLRDASHATTAEPVAPSHQRPVVSAASTAFGAPSLAFASNDNDEIGSSAAWSSCATAAAARGRRDGDADRAGVDTSGANARYGDDDGVDGAPLLLRLARPATVRLPTATNTHA